MRFLNVLKAHFRNQVYLNLTIAVIQRSALEEHLKTLQIHSVAPTSKKIRCAQWQRYQKFCNKFNLTALPAPPVVICRYVFKLSMNRLEYNTINNYVSALVSLQHSKGLAAPNLLHFSIKKSFNRRPPFTDRITLPAVRYCTCWLVQNPSSPASTKNDLQVNILGGLPDGFFLAFT